MPETEIPPAMRVDYYLVTFSNLIFNFTFLIFNFKRSFAFYVILLTMRQKSVQNTQKASINLVKRVEVGNGDLISLNLYVIIYAVEKRETELRC